MSVEKSDYTQTDLPQYVHPHAEPTEVRAHVDRGPGQNIAAFLAFKESYEAALEGSITEKVNKAAPILALVVLRMAAVGQTPDRSPLAPIVPQFLALPSSSRTLAPHSSERDSVSNPCTFHGLFQHAKIEAEEFGRGVASVPRNVVRDANLKWELPIAATTGILIAEGDQPLAGRIQGKSIQDVSRFWSNFGLGIEIASGGLAYVGGCARHRVYLRDTGLTMVDALAAAGTADLVLKLAFDRQFPYTPGSTGKFWGGGRSFPSGHAASSFAFATAIAHRYPDKPWLKLAAYGLATGVALSPLSCEASLRL